MRTEGLIPDDDYSTHESAYPEARLANAPRNDLLTWFASHQSERTGRGSDMQDSDSAGVAPDPAIMERLGNEFAIDCIDLYEQARNLLWRKHHDYGPKNIADAPGGALNGLLVRMHDKMARVVNLTYSDRDTAVKDEAVEDTLIDLANYSLIAVLVLRGKWPSG